MSNNDVIIQSSKTGATLRVTWTSLLMAVVATVASVVGGMMIAGDYRYADRTGTERRLGTLESDQKHIAGDVAKIEGGIREANLKLDEINRYLRTGKP